MSMQTSGWDDCYGRPDLAPTLRQASDEPDADEVWGGGRWARPELTALLPIRPSWAPPGSSSRRSYPSASSSSGLAMVTDCPVALAPARSTRPTFTATVSWAFVGFLLSSLLLTLGFGLRRTDPLFATGHAVERGPVPSFPAPPRSPAASIAVTAPAPTSVALPDAKTLPPPAPSASGLRRKAPPPARGPRRPMTSARASANPAG